MKNEEIKFGAEKILEKLSEIYEDLKAFVFYNDEFEQYELVISSVYEENDEFVKTLNKLLISEIISKKMYLYSYFTDEFEEMSSKYLDTNDSSFQPAFFAGVPTSPYPFMYVCLNVRFIE